MMIGYYCLSFYTLLDPGHELFLHTTVLSQYQPSNLQRCRSENKFPDNPLQNMVVRPASPTPSAPERLRVPEDECSVLRPQPSGNGSNTKHVSWGAATSTIRATYRFSSRFHKTEPRLDISNMKYNMSLVRNNSYTVT